MYTITDQIARVRNSDPRPVDLSKYLPVLSHVLVWREFIIIILLRRSGSAVSCIRASQQFFPLLTFKPLLLFISTFIFGCRCTASLRILLGQSFLLCICTFPLCTRSAGCPHSAKAGRNNFVGRKPSASRTSSGRRSSDIAEASARRTRASRLAGNDRNTSFSYGRDITDHGRWLQWIRNNDRCDCR